MLKSVYIITIYALLFFGIQARAENDIVGLETGIVYPSPWSAVRIGSTAYGFQMGEALDATIGTMRAQDKIKGAASFTYYLAQDKAGFGVATEYKAEASGADHFVNWVGAGIGTEFIQAGFNFCMDLTTWNFSHDLSLRFGKKEGVAIALKTPDVTSIIEQFTLGIGYLQSNTLQIEIDVPMDTTNMLWKPRVEMLRPSMSLSVLSIKSAILNIGIDAFNFGEQGGGTGSVHAGALYWFNNSLGIHLTVNKRYAWTLGITGKL